MITTERLHIREINLEDAPFMLALLNDPFFILNIGDRQVRTIEDAQKYIQEKILARFAVLGFGLNLVSLKETGVPVGVCGLVKRDVLNHPDIGYGFLACYSGRGYASEAGTGVIKYSIGQGHENILGVVKKDNLASIQVLKKLGLSYQEMKKIHEDQEDLMLFALKPIDSLHK